MYNASKIPLVFAGLIFERREGLSLDLQGGPHPMDGGHFFILRRELSRMFVLMLLIDEYSCQFRPSVHLCSESGPPGDSLPQGLPVNLATHDKAIVVVGTGNP